MRQKKINWNFYFYNRSMSPSLQKLYIKIENQREQLLQSLRLLSDEKRNAHPPGKWSINQIIAHLITAENLSIQYLNKKIVGINEAKSSGLVEELKMLILIISQRLPLKFKAPKVVVEHTSKGTDINTLADEWNNTRSELKKLLDRIEDQHISKKIYRHVAVGMLNIQQTLIFLKEHVNHHTPQIKKLLKQK